MNDLYSTIKITFKLRMPKQWRKIKEKPKMRISVSKTLPELGKLIKSRRRELNLSINDFAKAIKRSRTYINNLESDNLPKIDLEDLEKIETLLKVKLIKVEVRLFHCYEPIDIKE